MRPSAGTRNGALGQKGKVVDMTTIVERALRAAILAWDEKAKGRPSDNIFKMSADEAVEELKRMGIDERTIARRNQ